MRHDLPALYILRHGETTWNVQGRLQGGMDAPLTERGIAQACTQRALLQKHVPNWESLPFFCSPSGRAIATARIIKGDDFSIDARLREINLGDWQGRLICEIPEAQRPHYPNMLWKMHAPHGETLDAFEKRLTQFLQERTEAAIIVTHGVTSKALRGIALELSPSEWDGLCGGQGNIQMIKTGKNIEICENSLAPKRQQD